MFGLLDLIFPPRCVGCDRPGEILCPACREQLPRIDPGRACARCGAPLPSSGTPCPECRGRQFAFESARCAALLQPPVSRAVVLLKDGGERRCAEVLAELVGSCAADWLAEADVLVPLPASPDAVRRRGFDHALDITRALGRTSGCRVGRLLVARRTEDQRALGKAERFANRTGAFALAPGAAGTVPARVLLVDDVLTTGATLDAAATLLLSAGAVEVRALAVARACRA